MQALFLTRGFEQQFDYNVFERVKPWGAESHTRLEKLRALATDTSDFEFSFVLRASPSSWELLLNSLPSARRDFAGSPLRSYLFLAGNADDAPFILGLLRRALADFWPARGPAQDGPLCRALDEVATPDIVNRLAGWRLSERLDANAWSQDVLLPVLRRLTELPPPALKPAAEQFLSKANELLNGTEGILTGEYCPFSNNPSKDDPNLVLHFAPDIVIRVFPDGSQRIVRRSAPPPPPPLPGRQPPETGGPLTSFRPGGDRPGLTRLIASVALLVASVAFIVTFWAMNRQYVVQFVDEGGTVISSAAYPNKTAAEDIVIPAAPIKASTLQFTYTFAGWNPAVADVRGEATYTATYREELNRYTVHFVNENGTDILVDEYPYGTPATEIKLPPAPTKPATAQFIYTFAGWSPAVADVNGDATYTATYSSTEVQPTTDEAEPPSGESPAQDDLPVSPP